MKSLVRKFTPEFLLILKRWLFETYSLIVCTLYDFIRYMRFSSTYKVDTQERLLGKLILYYHVVEKGLSFEESRPGFGIQVLESLVDAVNSYIELNYDIGQLQFKTSCSVLVKYFEANSEAGTEVNELKSKLNSVVFDYRNEELGGKKIVTKEEILESVNIDFKRFFNSRHSIREFSDEKVETSEVIEAIDLAKKYPSVCNRQSVRTYLINSKEKVLEHLTYQNGNRGFRDKVDKVIVVTVDLGLFSKADERNQPFIDGGIYLMGLLLSLHSVGLGAVALNWSTNKESDKAYRGLGVINESETIISFVGIGSLKDQMVVPKSERNNIRDTLTVIK